MKTIFNTAGNIIGILIIIGAGVVLVLTLKGASPSDNQPTTFQSPIEKVVAPTATSALVQFSSPIKPTATPYVPPLCTFNAKTSVEELVPESLLDKYVFSEPKVILSHKGPIEISQWLPDNQRILISRENTDTGLSFIETVDIKTQRIDKYGEGHLGSLPPSRKFVWLTVDNSVAFTTLEPDSHYALHISQGEGTVETEAPDLVSGYLAVHPDGQQLTFGPYNSARPQSFDITTKQIQTLDTKGTTASSETEGYIDFWSRYQSVWHPDGKRLAYFNNQAFFLFNTESGETCEIDLGTIPDYGKRWALFAQWNPDGRYLAVRRTVGEPPVPFIDLTIIDTKTGKLRTLDIGDGENIYAIAWGANNRDILAIAQVVTRQNPIKVNGHNVYIVDTITGSYRQMLQNSEFFFSGNTGVAWTLDGEHIALMCPTFLPTEPTMDEGRLCIIDVEVK